MREQRRLAAIVSADVVGYSRLMGRDEAGTVARLRRVRAERLEPVLARRGGRIVKLTGDGALMEFGSAVEALSAAIEFQQAMAESEADRPKGERLVFRVGVHLGDVIVDGDDLYGDGVNIAARLEAEAQPGSIVISGAVYEATGGRLMATFDDLGRLALKNIERPVQAYAVRWQSSDWPPAPAVSSLPATATPAPSDTLLPLPDKPSIAVLAFINMSGDPEQEYFTDGITEDIITELSRFRSLFVIARNSSFSYKGKSPDIRQVGRELGVRYVLEGSIRKAANRIRVTGQLIDTLNGNHVWAERYDRVLEDVFAVQEELTRAIVGAIAPEIESIEQSRAARRHPSNLTAYEIALRSRAHAMEGYDKASRVLIDRAVQEAREALTIDPNCILALLALGRAHANSLTYQMATDEEHSFREATSAINRAIELDSTDPFGYALRGIIVLLKMQWDRFPSALADARHAHELNPNDPTVLRILGSLESVAGDPERAIAHLHQALRVNPRQSRSHEIYQMLGWANFIGKQYKEGIRCALRALNDAPTFAPAHTCLVACLVGAGEIEQAKKAFAEGQTVAPEFFRSRLEGKTTAARPEDRKRMQLFCRIAAGLEDPSLAAELR